MSNDLSYEFWGYKLMIYLISFIIKLLIFPFWIILSVLFFLWLIVRIIKDSILFRQYVNAIVRKDRHGEYTIRYNDRDDKLRWFTVESNSTRNAYKKALVQEKYFGDYMQDIFQKPLKLIIDHWINFSSISYWASFYNNVKAEFQSSH